MPTLRDFATLSTPREFIELAGGDIRGAETAAWKLWYASGDRPDDRNPMCAQMAIAIAETKFAHHHAA